MPPLFPDIEFNSIQYEIYINIIYKYNRHGNMKYGTSKLFIFILFTSKNIVHSFQYVSVHHKQQVCRSP